MMANSKPTFNLHQMSQFEHNGFIAFLAIGQLSSTAAAMPLSDSIRYIGHTTQMLLPQNDHAFCNRVCHTRYDRQISDD
jgi:hypothetical protein